MRALYEEAQTMSATNREVLLQSHGLRNVEVRLQFLVV